MENDKTSLKDTVETLYCAFVDILGFKEILRDWDAALEFYEEIVCGVFEGTPAWLTAMRSSGTVHKQTGNGTWASEPQRIDPAKKVRWRIVSDAIILTSPDLAMLTLYVQILQYTCLLKGKVLRGGIGRGRHAERHYQDHYLVLSEAFTAAYLAESKLARVPRTVIDPGMLDHLQNTVFSGDTIAQPHVLGRLVQGEDDLWFVNPLFSRDDGAATATTQALSAHADSEYVDKYLWLGDYVNFMMSGADVSDLRYPYYRKQAEYLAYLESSAAANEAIARQFVPTWRHQETFTRFFRPPMWSSGFGESVRSSGPPYGRSFADNVRDYIGPIAAEHVDSS